MCIRDRRDQSKRAGLLQWFRTLTEVPDIVCLQECYCSSDLECQTWFRASGYLCPLAAGSTHARGCIILFRPTLSLVQSWSKPDGRFLICEFRLCYQVFRVCCVYAPSGNPQRNQFLDAVSVSIDPSVPTVVISTPFSTGLLSVVDRNPLMYLVNHLVLYTASLTTALQSTSRDISILYPPAILGRGVMVRFLPVLTSS